MNHKQWNRMKEAVGFIAALDQSGGSTPKALKAYGIEPNEYADETEMFDLVHQMRTRIITSPVFTSEHILAAILFERTMNSQIEGKATGDYLWEEKGIVPFLKIDKGLDDLKNGVQMMKPMSQLDELLTRAVEMKMFGTKMRSVIKEAEPIGIKSLVAQQFELAKKIWSYHLVPIIEPEVDIHSPNKAKAEDLLLAEINTQMQNLPAEMQLMFKITIPEKPDLYADLMKHPQVVRVVALSGGYTTEQANALLAKNHNLIASFSRALVQNLNVKQSDAEFNHTLEEAIKSIYLASAR